MWPVHIFLVLKLDYLLWSKQEQHVVVVSVHVAK